MFKLSKEPIAADVEKFVNKATILIHSPETTAKFQKSLSVGDPVKQIALLTVTIIQRIDEASRQQGIETSDAVKVIAAYKIVELLCELGEAAGKFKLSQDFQTLALYAAIQDYFKGEIAAGRIDPVKFRQSAAQGIKSLPPDTLNATKEMINRMPGIVKQYHQGVQNG